MDERAWVSDDIPVDKPSPARVYDYYLGGYHNFQADRDVADRMEEIFPHVRLAAQANRAFLRRVITFLIEQGCDQFLDLGSGIPTVGNVHEVAQRLKPDTHVVYVDIDPVAVGHSQAMLRDNPRTVAIRADACDVQQILDHPDVRRLLDLKRPLAVLMVALLHYIIDDHTAQSTVDAYRSSVIDGSYLAIAHPVIRHEPPAVEAAVAQTVKRRTPTRDRSPEDIDRFFGDWTRLPPGLVWTPLWHPEGIDDLLLSSPEKSWTMVGVARKGAGQM